MPRDGADFAIPNLEEYRVEPCPKCGGDGGHDAPYGIDRTHGGLLVDWQTCRYCGGIGEDVIPVEPIEQEDLEDMAG